MIQTLFSHGGDVDAYERQYHRAPLDFSANINPLGMPAAAVAAYREAENILCRYPDPTCRRLMDALAGFEGLPWEWFLCGNGAADLIYRLAFAVRPQTALLTAPSFSEYERALHAAGAEIRFHPLQETDGFALTEVILPAIKGQKLLILCNPNNPTGLLTGKELMQEILHECGKQGCLLCVDECFMDLTEVRASLKDCLDNANLIILKAFTKTFAMPGLRLGYCMTSNRELLENMALCGPLWSVSVPAMACGAAALTEPGFLERTRSYLKKEREGLGEGLVKLGATIYPSQANYLFFRHPDPLLFFKLSDLGFLIRDCSNYRGLSSGYYRIAVRTTEENKAFLAAMERIVW